MRLFLATLAIAVLSGCANLKGTFENRATCTVAKDKALVVSMYGPIGIASKLSDADTSVICGTQFTK